jgi:phospholipid/cholesterol/gamma-HCH transport system ATP-binding protein
MGEPYIAFRGVKKAFGPKTVFQELTLEVKRGEVLTVCGGSGVGKSVLLKMLIGLLRHDSGSIVFDGEDITGWSEKQLAGVRQRIAMLFQSGALFDSLSVGENVAYGLHEHYHDQLSKEQIADRVNWALSLVNLPGIEAMSPGDLSGGMRKRVGLARAIAVQPEVVLYDEPTTGLDPINTARVNHLILGMQERLDITSIVITHDMKSAFSVSDRVAMVHQGRILSVGTVAEFRSSSDPRVQDFIEGRAPRDEDVATLLST